MLWHLSHVFTVSCTSLFHCFSMASVSKGSTKILKADKLRKTHSINSRRGVVNGVHLKMITECKLTDTHDAPLAECMCAIIKTVSCEAKLLAMPLQTLQIIGLDPQSVGIPLCQCSIFNNPHRHPSIDPFSICHHLHH
jgi:hypothetical protein